MKNRNAAAIIAADDPLWYKDAIIYELHVRAFRDTSGDGSGDFRGLLERMDYLADLGVTALWLLPFYPSPLRDDGYDIADYTDINPVYGTLADFKAVLREAHRRKMRVITEMVVNHTSDKHPWFQRARHAAPGSAWRDFYVWNDSPHKYGEARIIFTDFESSNWTWDSEAKAFYWHRFFSHQPDLNFDNPAVPRAIGEVLDFWLNLGIDGMRLDAVPYLYEREGTSCENLPETHDFLKALRKHVDERFAHRMLLAEANQWPEEAASYFGSGDECHMAFHFPLMPRLFMAIRMEDRFPIIDILQQTPAIPDNSQWALFLRNHDELTLEMVTAEDRDYMYRVYAQDAVARINLGIRRRLAPLLENHRGKIELMKGLLFSLPGTPVIYYGDEIGMGDNVFLGDRNGVRTPMQWSPERNAGFSTANPQRLYLPVVIDPEYHYQTVNVEAQQNNPHSLLWWMKRIIALRKQHQAFGRGSLEFLYPENHKVLVFLRRYQAEQILVVANLSRNVQCVEVDLGAFKACVPVEMFGRSALPVISERPYQLTLGPYAFYWLLLKPAVVHRPAAQLGSALPALQVSDLWQNVFTGPTAGKLENALLAFLQTQTWFTGKGGSAVAVHVRDNIPIDHGDAWIMLVQVDYAQGESKQFVLPIGFRKDTPTSSDGSAQPPPDDKHHIARLTITGEPDTPDQTGILFDALASKTFAASLFHAFTRHKRFRGAGGELLAQTTSAYHRLRDFATSRLDAELLKGGRSNTALAYGDQLVLKVYRWVEEGTHCEVEVAQALMDKAKFPHVAPLAGTLTYFATHGSPMTWASLAKFVPNEGDAWKLTQDAVRRFFEMVLTRHDQRPDAVVPVEGFVELAARELPAMPLEWLGSYLETARLMGRRTAELHLAMSNVDDAAFRPEPFTPINQRSTYQSARNWVFRNGQLLRRAIHDLPADTQANAQMVLGREADIIQHLRAILDRRIVAQRIRCHGDLSLHSLLYTGKDFCVIDFEGEVLRPLSTRRNKRLALRDLAGWLHSMHLAVLSVLRDRQVRQEDRPILQRWANFWHCWISVAYLKEYLAVAGTRPFLPKAPADFQLVLDYNLLCRAIHEIRYHLLNDCEHIGLPLESLVQLLNEFDRRQALRNATPPQTQAPLETEGAQAIENGSVQKTTA
jgi:maltose alpha-D-glucosyltransferase/alpha-amylase